MHETSDILFATLADPNRRAIFERLCHEGEQTVSALTSWVKISQPAVSKHLCLLKQAELVLNRHEGRNTHYRARPYALTALVDWTSQMYGFCNRLIEGEQIPYSAAHTGGRVAQPVLTAGGAN